MFVFPQWWLSLVSLIGLMLQLALEDFAKHQNVIKSSAFAYLGANWTSALYLQVTLRRKQFKSYLMWNCFSAHLLYWCRLIGDIEPRLWEAIEVKLGHVTKKVMRYNFYCIYNTFMIILLYSQGVLSSSQHYIVFLCLSTYYNLIRICLQVKSKDCWWWIFTQADQFTEATRVPSQ